MLPPRGGCRPRIIIIGIVVAQHYHRVHRPRRPGGIARHQRQAIPALAHDLRGASRAPQPMAVDAQALVPRLQRRAVEGGSRADFFNDHGAVRLAECQADFFAGGAFDYRGG